MSSFLFQNMTLFILSLLPSLSRSLGAFLQGTFISALWMFIEVPKGIHLLQFHLLGRSVSFYLLMWLEYFESTKWTSMLLQLLWRDFFYTVAFGTPNFDKMRGNRICKQVSKEKCTHFTQEYQLSI